MDILTYVNQAHDFFMWLNTYFEDSIAWKVWPNSPSEPGSFNNHYWIKWISPACDKNPIIFWNMLHPEKRRELYMFYVEKILELNSMAEGARPHVNTTTKTRHS